MQALFFFSSLASLHSLRGVVVGEKKFVYLYAFAIHRVSGAAIFGNSDLGFVSWQVVLKKKN
jgi:hypothetical protein